MKKQVSRKVDLIRISNGVLGNSFCLGELSPKHCSGELRSHSK